MKGLLRVVRSVLLCLITLEPVLEKTFFMADPMGWSLRRVGVPTRCELLRRGRVSRDSRHVGVVEKFFPRSATTFNTASLFFYEHVSVEPPHTASGHARFHRSMASF